MIPLRRRLAVLAWLLIVVAAGPAGAADAWLARIHRQVLLSPTVPDNGDQNPYAVVVAPVSSGAIHAGDVLVTNFNDETNLQGTGSTIVRVDPVSRRMTLFARLPRQLAACPGGVGLSTAMVMLRSGWVIVGSAPSTDGMAHSLGAGCLLVLNSQGQLVETWAGADIAAPWGNMAVIDRGDQVSLFVSNAGFGVGGAAGLDPATGYPPVVRRASVLRLDLAVPAGKAPAIVRRVVVADGFGARGDASVFLIGPTGLALGADGRTLYVSDALGDRICAVDRADQRTDSGGTGRVVSEAGMLRRPLAMAMTPAGHLLVVNGLNGQVVEIDPRAGEQLAARWVDANRAQSPPGSGDLFGIAMTPAGDGFYFVEDEINSLMLAR